MTQAYTRSEAATITETRKIAAKVAADLLQLNAFYNLPSIQLIERLAEEAAKLQSDGYLGKLQYGFKRAGAVLLMLEYVPGPGGRTDDAPGQVPYVNLVGATWFSFLTHSPKWWLLTDRERATYEATLPIQRTFGDAPTIASGIYYGNAKSYSTEHASMTRTIVGSKP